jgi:hypothetical protein
MIFEANRFGLGRMRWIGLGTIALACSACASEEIASAPADSLPPAMVGVKSPSEAEAKRVAAKPSDGLWSPSRLALPENPSDPATMMR